MWVMMMMFLVVMRAMPLLVVHARI